VPLKLSRRLSSASGRFLHVSLGACLLRRSVLRPQPRSVAYLFLHALLDTFSLLARALERELGRSKIEMYDWLQQKRSIEVEPIVPVPSPLRNKSEFTFGYRYFNENSTAEADTVGSPELKRIPAVGYVALLSYCITRFS
jgi:hypothetical protein